ncbi:hypothetical protein PACTADRAFT_39894, partial [Pachysolen tannophilus NRRL Y-2460]
MFHLRSGSSSNNNSQPVLFEIRIKSSYKNIILIKGSEYEAPSIYLSGSLVFSLPEQMSVFKINLKLIGCFKLDFMEVLTHNNRITSSNPVKANVTTLKYEWDNLLVSNEGSIITGDYAASTTNTNTTNTSSTSSSSSSSTTNNNNSNNSAQNFSATNQSTTASNSNSTSNGSTSNSNNNNNSITNVSSHNNNRQKQKPSRLKRPGAPTTLQLPESSINNTPFENVKTPTGSNIFVLPKGNYELPFKCVLPGNLPETIEGLQSGSMMYKFEASLMKSSSLLKHNHFIKYKYLRIFRTLSPNDVALSEDVSIENTWPGRVQYEVNIPRKAIPIGGSTPVNIVIVPLKKGLKLGKISAAVVQHYVLKDPNQTIYDHDDVIYDCELPPISMDSFPSDRWSINATIVIPSDLKSCTQDCDLKDGIIKVRHKLKFKIKIVNAEDGHLSELRAKLPIILYVNPKYKIYGRNIDLDHNGKIHIKPGMVPLF